MYLVAPASMHPEEVMIPFIRRALDASVKRFVLLSSASIPENGPVFGAVHHYLRQHAPEWAVLRPSYFMQNFTNAGHGHGYSLRQSVTGREPRSLEQFISLNKAWFSTDNQRAL
ncbi:uncharacterized protein YbjT (DUF2867 family) [Paenibacillus favisporus]|uniref:Uncharacterized protein YbjT (DUF2867 family) n=1 Tax=Paenibacillus favisporus TaxID=221028 RepID=A0ABV2F3P0_9BACL